MKLLELLKKSPGKIIPAVGDGSSFRQFSQTHSPALFLAGHLVAQTLIAEEDEGLLSVTEYARFTHQMRLKKQQPLILDMQSGFGNPLNAYYAAQKLERNGADILLLNDQSYPSHTTDQPQVTTAADFIGKVRASLDSLEDPATQLWIKLEGIRDYGIEGVLQRIQYARNAGAAAAVVDHYSRSELAEMIRQKPALPLLAAGLPDQRVAGVVAWLDKGSFIDQSQVFQQQMIQSIDWEVADNEK